MNKKGSGRNGRSLNKMIRGCAERFKLVGNSQVSLSEAMNSMAKLIGEQVEILSDKTDVKHGGEYNKEHRPDLVSLLEMRVSGEKADSIKADSIIARLSFLFSHRVEAIGFLGGIWIGWKESVFVEALKNHSQFVLVKVSDNYSKQHFLVAFVYGSPNTEISLGGFTKNYSN